MTGDDDLSVLTNAETTVTTIESTGIIQGGLRYRIVEIQTVGMGEVHVKPPSYNKGTVE